MSSRTLLTVLALTIVGACSPQGAVSDTTFDSSTTSTSLSTTTTTDPPAPTTTLAPATTTTTTPSPTTTVLAGEPVDLGPRRGAVLGVVGVRHDDVLNIRSRPGASQPRLGGIPPTADDVEALGETRSLPAFWTRVEHNGTVGWVNMSFLAYLGQTTDITSELKAQLGPSIEAATMEELGRLVADFLASDDPPSRIVEVVEQTTGGDLGEVTFDLIGLGDDSVLGVRLHVFGEPLDDLWRVRSVEQTLLCHPTRDVDDDGICA